MKFKKRDMKMLKSTILPLIALVLMLASCKTDPLSPGLEYMPDMYRSPAIEEYVDYGEIRDRINDSLADRLSAMVPPEGTIPYASKSADAKFNFPYPYENTDEGYAMASANLRNPIVFDEGVYNEGKRLYGKFCVHCHGEKGKGQGSITKGGAFPPPPSYSNILGLTQGKMFHTLMYGKGNMGSHASQLNKKQLWTLVHYVQTLRDDKSDYASAIKKEVEVETDETETN